MPDSALTGIGNDPVKPGTLHLIPLRDFPAVLAGDSLGELVVSATRAQGITPDASSALIVAQKCGVQGRVGGG